MNKKIITGIISAALCVSLFAGCGTSKVGTAKDGNEMKIEAAAIKLVNAQKSGGYELIDVAGLKKLIDEKKDIVVIDTMPNDFYKKGHVPGAVNAEMPKASLEDASKEQKEAFVKMLGEDKDKIIVVYCGFTACGRSHVGASYAEELGYKNVYRLPGGIIGWQDAEYEVEK